MGRHIKRILGSLPQYTLAQAAHKLEVSEEKLSRQWVVMGFGEPDPREPLFTDYDITVLREVFKLIADGFHYEDTILALMRAQAHMAYRLMAWQNDIMTSDIARRWHLDNASARAIVLDRMDACFEQLERFLLYSARRQLVQNLSDSVGDLLSVSSGDIINGEYQLNKAVGFIDMVSYTSTTIHSGSAEVTRIIDTFEATVRDTVSRAHGKVIKTIGDAALFIADDLSAGLEMVLDLRTSLQSIEAFLPVRASLSLGPVMLRHGDVYGEVVNLASRLMSKAPVGGILIDENTAEKIANLPTAPYYRLSCMAPQSFAGIGEVTTYLLDRSAEDYTI